LSDGGLSRAKLADRPVLLSATLRTTLVALAVGSLGGWLATLAGLPLGWMIGAMIATTAAAALGAPIAMPIAFRHFMVTVLGIMLGSGFSPEMLDRIGEWALSLASLALYAAAAGGAGLFYFRRICWLRRGHRLLLRHAGRPCGDEPDRHCHRRRRRLRRDPPRGAHIPNRGDRTARLQAHAAAGPLKRPAGVR